MTDGLKLLAEDEEDLGIISAHVQDAITRIGDLVYLPKSRRFAALINRYCWEGCGDDATGERRRAGLHFNGVLKVKALNVRQNDPNAVVEMLMIKFTPMTDGAGTIDILLAGGGCIRLEVEAIDGVLRDMEEHWRAAARPKHGVETP